MSDIDEQRAEAAQVLQDALTTIREITVFRNREPHELSSDARVMAGYLADAVHNLPHFVAGTTTYFDSSTPRVIAEAKQIIAAARDIPSHEGRLVRRDRPRRFQLKFWQR